MTALDPSDSLQHYPLAMAKFGLNPFGENRFRIVLASTRKALVCGQWNGAGMPRGKYCSIYPHLGQNWILEEWMDAFNFAGPSVMWDDILGPYPTRGEYVMCGNSSFDPEQTNIEKLISMVHASDKYSWAEKLAACRQSNDLVEREKKNLREAIILDCLPAFGHAPFSQLSTGRGGAGKSSPVLRSANELGLPVPQGVPGQATTGGGMIVKKKRRKRAA
jgi:hypothetical protein